MLEKSFDNIPVFENTKNNHTEISKLNSDTSILEDSQKSMILFSSLLLFIFIASNKISSTTTTETGEESLSKSIESNPEADLNIQTLQENDNLPRKNRQFSTTQGI